jgi:hypothetical protein
MFTSDLTLLQRTILRAIYDCLQTRDFIFFGPRHILPHLDPKLPLGVVVASLSGLHISGILLAYDEKMLGPDKHFYLSEMGAELSHEVVLATSTVLQTQEPSPLQGAIPASDRFVSRSDNAILFEKAEHELDTLIEAVRTANDLKVTADERLAIISEVEGVRALIKQPVVRIRAIYDAIRANSLLRWLAAVAGAGIVGDKAVAAVNALLALLGL